MTNEEMVNKILALETEVSALKLAVRALVTSSNARVQVSALVDPRERLRATPGLDASDPIGG